MVFAEDWFEIKESLNIFEIDPDLDRVMQAFSPEKMAEQRKNNNENLECFSPKHKTEFVQFTL